MLGCWEIEPENRPNFESLASDLVASLASMADYLMLEQDEEISVTASGNGNNSPWYIPHAAFKRGEYLDNVFVNLQHLEENMRDTSRPASYVDPNSMPCSDNETEDGFITPEPNRTGMTAQRWGGCEGGSGGREKREPRPN